MNPGEGVEVGADGVTARSPAVGGVGVGGQPGRGWSPGRLFPAEHDTQRRLDHRLDSAQAGVREWSPRITTAAPAVAGDPRLPALAARLAALHRTRADVPELLTTAAHQSRLPDDHPADALNYRITDLIKRRERQEPTWETVTSPDLTRHLHHPPPPTPTPTPDPGPAVSF